jgi:hypothetical protein
LANNRCDGGLLMKPLEHSSPEATTEEVVRAPWFYRAWAWLKQAWREEPDFEGRQF